MSHTPWPWKVGDDEPFVYAAAPELADALERTVNALDLVLRQLPLRDATEIFEEARRALEKAGRI